MLSFSDDVDILRYEPVLFGELHFSSQMLTSGENAALNGTTFTKSGEDFVSAGVEAGGVIYLQSSDLELDGCYEVVSVDSATQLTVSVLRADREGDAVAPPSGTGISYRVSTFRPQANEAFFQLTQHFGIRPGCPNSVFDAEDISDAGVLRQVSVLAVLANVYAIIAGRSEFSGSLWQKSFHYQKLFARAKERCRVSVDIDSDGEGDITVFGGAMKLVRE